MAIRTVRLDDEAEAVLQRIRKVTGLPISEALKRGLRSLEEKVQHDSSRTPYAVYRKLDLGPGGYAIAPSSDVARVVRRAIAKKLRR